MGRNSWSLVIGILATHGGLGDAALRAQDADAIRIERDLAYAWSQRDGRTEYGLDVYARSGLSGAPVVISLHGGSGDKDAPSYMEVSRRLAAEDLVVFNVTYPGASPTAYLESGGEPLRAALGVVLCATRFAADRAPLYGGDPANVLVLGHSAGGYMGLVVSLLRESLHERWDTFASERGAPTRSVECAVDGRAPAPKAFVGFNGAYFVFRFFGLPDRDPALWELVDPGEYVELEPSLKTRFLLGSEDATQPPAHLEMIARFSEDRRRAGADSRVVEVRATHGYSFEPAAWSRTLASILELIRADSVRTGSDFYHAAMVLQHGEGSGDVLLAHVLATAAAFAGDERGKWLSAASLDRYLHRTRTPQLLGTQYLRSRESDPYTLDSSAPWSQGPYEEWLPDSVREVFGVVPLADQAERVRAMNRGAAGRREDGSGGGSP